MQLLRDIATDTQALRDDPERSASILQRILQVDGVCQKILWGQLL